MCHNIRLLKSSGILQNVTYGKNVLFQMGLAIVCICGNESDVVYKGLQSIRDHLGCLFNVRIMYMGRLKFGNSKPPSV